MSGSRIEQGGEWSLNIVATKDSEGPKFCLGARMDMSVVVFEV